MSNTTSNTKPETPYADVFGASLEEAQNLFKASQALDTPLNSFKFWGGIDYVWYVRQWQNARGVLLNSFEAQMADDKHWFKSDEIEDMSAPLVLTPQLITQVDSEGEKVSVWTGRIYAAVSLYYRGSNGQFTGLNGGFGGWKSPIRENGSSKVWAKKDLDNSAVQGDIRHLAGTLFLSKAAEQKSRQTGTIIGADGSQQIIGFYLVKLHRFNIGIRVNSQAATVLYFDKGFNGSYSVVPLPLVPEHLEGIVKAEGNMVLRLDTSVMTPSGVKPVRSLFEGDQMTEEGLEWFLQNFAEPLSRSLKTLDSPVIIPASTLCADYIKGDYSNATAPARAQKQVLPELQIPEATVEVSKALFNA